MKWVCNSCQQDWDETDVQERYSLGIYAGRWCSKCWMKAGYRQEGQEGFDAAYAGESYEAE